jgi:riboflavin kinase/FMN adenylyltransferase
VQPFTVEFANLQPHEFVKDVLVNRWNTKVVVVGFNYVFGKNGTGNTSILEDLGKRYGFHVDVVEPITVDSVVIGSSQIRNMLLHGNVEDVVPFLGRRFVLRGRVVEGFRRGRVLGFPTANLDVSCGLLIPKDGVYVTGVTFGGREYCGVCNIGSNPTFKSIKRTIEVHIIGFSGMLYGQDLSIQFMQRLRDEITFSDCEELKRQIQADIKAAEVYWKQAESFRITR